MQSVVVFFYMHSLVGLITMMIESLAQSTTNAEVVWVSNTCDMLDVYA
jgi:hypothetical protein